MTATLTRKPSSRRPPARPSAVPAKGRRKAEEGIGSSPSAAGSRRRCLGLLVAMVVAFALVVGRLAMLQVVDPEVYEERGLDQRLRTVILPAERGAIFDRNGDELAMSVPRSTVVADPRLIADPIAAAAALDRVLGADPERAADLGSGASFVYVARQVEDTDAEAVRRLDIRGVSLIEESTRVAPAGALGRSLLGRVDPDGRGTSGLEEQYENRLVGTPGELLLERGPDGQTIAQGQRRLDPAERGDDLVLTIDRTLQFEVERALADQVDDVGADGGTAVVMDPRSGEVLALANVRTPSEGGRPQPSADNMALVDAFEPGSVTKAVTMAAALEEGRFTPEDTLLVPYRLEVPGKTYTDHDPHEDGNWTMADILAWSSNVGTIKVAQQLGGPVVEEYLRRFGLAAPTGLVFPDENIGRLSAAGGWEEADLASISIGQGLSVNALQMLGVYNTVANGGVHVDPTLVRATVDGDGSEHPAPEPARRRAVSEETATALASMLSRVVTDGTGPKAEVGGYTVAGKTGTAYKFVDGGYEDSSGRRHYTASFAGFVPAEDPQLSAIVVIDEPGLARHVGGEAAAPVFSRIASYALRQLRIPPPSVASALEEVPAYAPRVPVPND